MSNNKLLKNNTKLLVNLDKFIFLVNAADSLEEIEIIRDLCEKLPVMITAKSVILPLAVIVNPASPTVAVLF